MKGAFTADAGELAEAVKYAARWVAARPAVPAHAGLLAEILSDSNGRHVLRLSGFNETVTGRASLAVQEAGDREAPEGAFVVSGRLLDALCGTLSGGDVRFDENGAEVTVSHKRFRGGLPVMSENDYPGLPDAPPTVGVIDGGELARVVRLAAVAAGRDPDLGAQWLGICLRDPGDGTLELIASDRYRFVQQIATWSPDAGLGDPLLVPAAALVDAVGAFEHESEVRVGRDAGAFSLMSLRRSLRLPLLDVTLFPHEQVVPMVDMPRDASVTFSVKDAQLPLRRIDLLKNKDTDRIDLTMRPGAIEFSADAGEALGNGDDEIDAEYAGDDTTISLRSRVLREALASAPGDTVTMSFVAGKPKPALLVTDADPSWRHVIVPLRPSS